MGRAPRTACCLVVWLEGGWTTRGGSPTHRKPTASPRQPSSEMLPSFHPASSLPRFFGSCLFLVWNPTASTALSRPNGLTVTELDGSHASPPARCFRKYVAVVRTRPTKRQLSTGAAIGAVDGGSTARDTALEETGQRWSRFIVINALLDLDKRLPSQGRRPEASVEAISESHISG